MIHSFQHCASTQPRIVHLQFISILSSSAAKPCFSPTTVEYKAPPTANLQTANTFQQILEYGLTFQLPQIQTEHPFLTPYEGILRLQENILPLTHFTQNNATKQTYDTYERLFNKLKQHLKTEKLQILQADKGPGLILIHNSTLTEIYNNYLQTNGTQITNVQYNNTVRRIKHILYLMNVNIKEDTTTDDRLPTMYFKIKTHKQSFQTYPINHPEIYTYTLGAKDLTNIARPIINHKNRINTHCSNVLTTLSSPIIADSKFLTKDLHETISLLCQHGPPGHIFTGDKEKFDPNTPHSLFIEALAHYYPRATGERHVLRILLEYNFATDRREIYHLGDLGIPMGLSLAPKLARMCTAYLLKDYSPPPNESLTLYFDDVAATHPIEDLPLAPYTLNPKLPQQGRHKLANTVPRTLNLQTALKKVEKKYGKHYIT
eukprot:TRINITY_DN2925_c0_g1_i2.p1 TRINITY_DN2925_c0_g1~~TRINITY_DN2925_c0_g1_i2.p1  ORF type:complete len:432 (-),score=12.92 TRINITY_DN2925_c0_g1_i2:1261-2556(-)